MSVDYLYEYNFTPIIEHAPENGKYIKKYSCNTHSTSAVCSHRDRTVDFTKGSMFTTLAACLLLVSVFAPAVKGDCTVVVNGANGPGSQAGGAVYTRWGRTVCPQGATLVYAGRAAGTKYNVEGGTTDTLCMPETPQYLSTATTATHVALLRGVEFQTHGTSSTPLNDLIQADMPCAVCHTDTKLSVLTVPAQYTCPNGWSMEYNGYLMTEFEKRNRQRKNTLCVDQDAEAVPESEASTDPAVVYLMSANCDGLPCPPYNNNMALLCAVCSK